MIEVQYFNIHARTDESDAQRPEPRETPQASGAARIHQRGLPVNAGTDRTACVGALRVIGGSGRAGTGGYFLISFGLIVNPQLSGWPKARI